MIYFAQVVQILDKYYSFFPEEWNVVKKMKVHLLSEI